MGNITGAMVFQSAVPTVLGLLTPWVFSEDSLIYFASAGVAFASTILISEGCCCVVGSLHGRCSSVVPSTSCTSISRSSRRSGWSCRRRIESRTWEGH